VVERQLLRSSAYLPLPPTQRHGEEGKPMVKMSIRKAGTIRLTSAAYYCCHLAAA
jgi:hypothetical protein